jgi:hypothetical protein
MKLVSYKDLSKDCVLNLISQIPQNFEGWQNYNSDTQAGLPYLLYEQERFDDYDFYFLLDNERLVACGGFYEFNDMMLIAVRTYTWDPYRFEKVHFKKIVPVQILRSYFEFKKDAVYMTVNNYNRKMFRVFNTLNNRKIKGLSEGNLLTIEPFLEIQEDSVIIQNVSQYVAKLSIDDRLKGSEYWRTILQEYNDDL